VINLYIGEYVDRNRQKLQSTYPDFKTFDKELILDEAYMKPFFEKAESLGVKFDEKGYQASEKLIKSQIKGLIAEKLWDISSFYQVANQVDEEVQKAVEVVENDAMFDKLKIDR